MKKINIHAKVRLSFFFVFVVMLLVTLYLFVQIKTIGEQTRLLYEHPFRVSNIIRDVKAEIYLNQNLVSNIRYTENDRQIDSLKAEIDKKDKAIKEGFKIVSLQFLGTKVLVDSTFAAYAALDSSYDKFYRLKKENKTDSIQTRIQSDTRIKFDKTVLLLTKISDFAGSKAENTFKKVIEAENNSILTSIILIIVSGLLFTFFIWYLTQSIARPIKSFVEEANILLKKDEKAPVIADEQILAETLAELKNAYLSIERQNREIELKKNQIAAINIDLEDKVKQRTAELNMANNELVIQYEASQHLSSIVESSEDAIISKSLDGTIKSWNYAAEKMFDYTAEEIIGKHISMLIPPAFINDEQVILDKIQNGETIEHYETVRMKKSGKQLHVSLTVSPLKNNEGKITGVSKIARDITLRKRAEDEVKYITSRLTLATQAGGVGIWDYDLVNDILVCDDQIFKLYGVDKKNFPGTYKAWLAGVHPDDVERVEAETRLAIMGIKEFNTEFRVVWQDGTVRFIRALAVVQSDDSCKPSHIIGTNWDITAHKDAEQALHENELNLKRINAVKDKFFSIVAHDLRSPFNGFLGLTNFMAEELQNLTQGEIQEMAVSMRNSAANMFRLLENLLEWARMQQGLITFNREIAQLAPIVDESIAIILESAKIKGIEINLDIPADITVFADRNILQTVIRNIVSNAVKFTFKGGKIGVAAKVTDYNNVEISIEDTGIGMSNKMIDDLFRLDVQTNRKGTDGEPSSGLGLLLCKDFIEKQGGKIWVESRVGKGSTFRFILPVQK